MQVYIANPIMGFWCNVVEHLAEGGPKYALKVSNM